MPIELEYYQTIVDDELPLRTVKEELQNLINEVETLKKEHLPLSTDGKDNIMINDRLEKLDPWLEHIVAFLVCYAAYAVVAGSMIILVYLTLGLQWFVNAYLDPAEPVGFLICGVSVIFGGFVLGLWAWEKASG